LETLKTPTLRLLRVAIDLMDGGPCLDLSGLAPGAWRPVNDEEQGRLSALLRRKPRATAEAERPNPSHGQRRHSPGRGGRAGGGKSGRAGGGG